MFRFTPKPTAKPTAKQTPEPAALTHLQQLFAELKEDVNNLSRSADAESQHIAASRQPALPPHIEQRNQEFKEKVVPYFTTLCDFFDEMDLTLKTFDHWTLQIIFNDATPETKKHFEGVSIAWPYPMGGGDEGSLEIALIRKRDNGEYSYIRFSSEETGEYVSELGITYHGSPKTKGNLKDLWLAVTKLYQIAKTQTDPYTPISDSDSDDENTQESAPAAARPRR